MTKTICRFAMFALAAISLSVTSIGCGGDDPAAARPDIAEKSPEEHFGSSTKALLYEFRAKVRKHGVTAVKNELPILLENMSGIEQAPVGDQGETYKQIVEKLQAMQSMTSKDAVVKAANEIGELAGKLPGTANENPMVE